MTGGGRWRELDFFRLGGAVGDVVAVLSRLAGHSREVELGSGGYVEKGRGCEQCWPI